MRHPDIDYLYVMERRRDELADAENYRLFMEAKAAQPRRAQRSLLPASFMLSLANFLSWIGERMLKWSCRLQYRYTVLAKGMAGSGSSPCG